MVTVHISLKDMNNLNKNQPLMLMDAIFKISQRNYPDMLHIKREDGKLKQSQFPKMHLKNFEGLYFQILLPFFFFLLLLLLWVRGIFIVSVTPTVLWKTVGGGKMRYWLTYHIGRRKIDSIRLFSRLHKWTKWNNRLVMSEVVWSRGEKIFQTKLQLLSWWITIGMFFQLWKNIPVSI